MPNQIDGRLDGTLVVRSRGEIDIRETVPVLRVLKGIFSPGPGFVLWVHEAGSRYAGSKDEWLRLRLGFAAALEERGEGAIALICPELPAYGLSRQMQSLVCSSRVKIEVFRETAEAEEWLRDCRDETDTLAMIGGETLSFCLPASGDPSRSQQWDA